MRNAARQSGQGWPATLVGDGNGEGGRTSEDEVRAGEEPTSEHDLGAEGVVHDAQAEREYQEEEEREGGLEGVEEGNCTGPLFETRKNG